MITRSLELWRKVLALLKFSNRRLSILVFVLTVLEIVLLLGALFVIKYVVELMATTQDIRENVSLIFGYVVIILGMTIEWLILPASLIAVALVMYVQIRFTRERFERQRALTQKESGSFFCRLSDDHGTFCQGNSAVGHWCLSARAVHEAAGCRAQRLSGD